MNLREQMADVIKYFLDGCDGEFTEPDIADAIIAALPGMVSPLVWECDDDLPTCEDAVGANTRYRVLTRLGGNASLRVDMMNAAHSEHISPEAAKSAAQAHHVATIMQALGINA